MSVPMRQPLWPGVPLALAAAFLFGLSTPASKYLLGGIDPWMLAGILYLGAGVGLFVFRQISTETSETPLARQDLPWLAAVIAAGGIAGPLLLMFGLTRSSASSASLLLNLESIFTMVLAWLVFRENVDRRLLVGAFAILCGALVLSWTGQGIYFNEGALFIAGACLAWGIDNNLTRKLSAADPTQIAMLKGLVAGAVNLGLSLYLGAAWPPAWMFAAGAVLGFFSVGMSLVCFMLGLRHLGVARTSAYFALAPFVGAALSVLFLNESLTTNLFIAVAFMGLGLWIHLSERHEHDHTHEVIEHDHVHGHDEHHDHTHEVEVVEPHAHWHRHEPMRHKHPHYPDLHHRHSHK